MAYKSILTLIRPDQDDSPLDSCLGFAGDAYLMVMVVAEAPPVPASAYDMLNGENWTLEVEQARAWAKERAEGVEAYLARQEAGGQVMAHVSGPAHLPDLIANACRYADLAVVPPGDPTDLRLQRAIVVGALFESGTPMLIGSAGKALSRTPGTVLIGWNATPEASRAVKQALPILRAASKVKAVLVDPVPSPLGHGDEPGANLAVYLGHHGIEADILRVPSTGKSIEDVLRDQVRSEGADLLVIGAYGHSRLRERIFGGTTLSMLEDPPCPVFLSH